MKNKLIRGTITLFAIMLTARAGKINNPETGFTESWYDLPMSKVVQQAKDAGIPCELWIREDGVKMFGPWVICASHPSKTRFSRIQTSLGEGIILDRHTCNDPELIDIATDWKE